LHHSEHGALGMQTIDYLDWNYSRYCVREILALTRTRSHRLSPVCWNTKARESNCSTCPVSYKMPRRVREAHLSRGWDYVADQTQGRGRGRQVVSVAKTADLILLMSASSDRSPSLRLSAFPPLRRPRLSRRHLVSPSLCLTIPPKQIYSRSHCPS
jgi:hypothetical protein